MNKVKSRIIKGSIIGLTFFVAMGCAYFLTPNRVRKGTFVTPVTPETLDESHFMKFINRFALDTGISESDENERVREYYGMHADFDDFKVEFKKDDNSMNNVIKFDGDLDFLMRGLKDINFNLDLDVDYNSKELPLEIGYVNKTFYFGLKDLRMKVGSTSIDELVGDPENEDYGLLYRLFMESKEAGGINFDIESYINDGFNVIIEEVLGNFDIGDVASQFSLGGLEEGQAGIGVQVNEQETSKGYDFFINIDIRKENEEGELTDSSFDVTISVNKEYRLTRIDLGTIDFGNVKLSGAIDINCIKNYEVLCPDNENYARYNPNYNYVEVINYKGWLQKLANFLDEENQKFGIDFNFDLKGENVDIGRIDGSINADFSKIIDISNYQYRQVGSNLIRYKANDEESVANKIRNQATFGLKLNMFGQNDVEYGNLSLKYKEGEGYINLNESLDENDEPVSVLKAKIETETMNWIIDELPGMVKEIGEADNTSAALAGLFSFITDSELVTAVKEGDYSAILDLLKDLRNDENTITIALDLSSIGLGDDSSVELVLDSRMDNKILNLNINNVKLGSLEMDASIRSNGYQDIVLDDETSYDSLSFLPTVFDQVYDISQQKQLGFEIEGSLMDEKNLGITLSGNGQLDYGEKFGFGDLTINQYKYEGKGVWYSHKIALDVDNRDGDYANNNVFFAYGDLSTSKNIKGKVTVQSLLDVIDVFKTFINDVEDNPKFSKFIAPIMKTLSLGEFSDIINNKDYIRLAKNDVLKSVKRIGDSITVVIGGSLFEMNNDITIKINLKDDRLDALEIVNVPVKEQTLNLKVSLKEYDTNKKSKLKTTDAYIDFSTLQLLVKFGLNTTKNDYYHLTAQIDLSALAIINVDFEMEVHILIKDEYVKIYGIIPDAKLSNLLGSVVQDYGLFSGKVKSEFTFETYPQDDPNREDGVGGYFHIKTTVNALLGSGKTIKHYKTTSKNLIKSENIMPYLLNDLLLIKTSVTEKIGDLSLNKDEEQAAGDFTNLFTSTGYSYNASKKQWNIGINLNEITGIDALRELELAISGRNDETLSKLVASLNVKASLVTIELGATINLDPLDPSITNWSSSIESAFNVINSVNFPESKLNQPFEYISQ